MTNLVTVLIGPPCSGKSTYLKTLDYDFVISSDDVVEILCKRESIQYHDFFALPANSVIRKEQQTIFIQLIKESKKFEHVVWDLTNLTKKARKSIFKHYPTAIFNAVVFDFKGSEELLFKRNKARSKTNNKWIAENVIEQMLLRYEPVAESEGFMNIKLIALMDFDIDRYSINE
ncbi:ATP-binding protein [Colwellia sp. E2M01]|uniref:ATP-binding protein n=1 Tax=Colwellia sp. E2M01 TaxID=2841561 RepID=UPI001C0A3E7D|nr:ATP-binding protein [Colwellia sp. E2M01]MBU2869753.1 ATP-binding protein [Colwellia sp. E2M01]